MTEPLLTLLQQLERERDQARVALLQAENTSNRALAQHDQLLSYQADTRARAPGRSGQAASVVMLQLHQGFSERLDQALLQQQGVLERSQADLLTRRERLLQAELKVAAVQKLLQRRAAEQDQIERRRDQRQTDESALLRHRQRSSSGFGGLA
jgi:flagellar protein FliJ